MGEYSLQPMAGKNKHFPPHTTRGDEVSFERALSFGRDIPILQNSTPYKNSRSTSSLCVLARILLFLKLYKRLPKLWPQIGTPCRMHVVSSAYSCWHIMPLCLGHGHSDVDARVSSCLGITVFIGSHPQPYGTNGTSGLYCWNVGSPYWQMNAEDTLTTLHLASLFRPWHFSVKKIAKIADLYNLQVTMCRGATPRGCRSDILPMRQRHTGEA